MMNDSPETRSSLLVRLREPGDSAAWSEFVDLYAPLIYGFTRRSGLQDADAADVTQEVLRAVARSAREFEYDPNRGSFRAWLLTVARNKLRNFLASQARSQRGSGDTNFQQILEQLPADQDQRSDWDQEYDHRLFDWAAKQVQSEVQPATWQAFFETAIAGRSPQDVAAQLEMTVANVYRAKNRVMNRLRQRVQELQAENDAP